MTVLYDWSRWFNAAPPAKEEAAGDGLIPARSRHPAELVNVMFRKADGILGGVDRIFTFRITSGRFNNREVNYKVKAANPGRIRPLMNAIMPNPKERGDMVPNRDPKAWLNALRGRSAIIVVDVFKEWNYISDITT